MKVTAITLTVPDRKERFLRPMLELAKRWSYQPDEWLIIDGPEDVGTKRNRAIGQAKGDVIVFLDDDDWHHPNRIEKQVAALANFPGGLVGTTNFFVHDVRTGIVTRSRTWGGAACFPAGSMAFWRAPALEIGFRPGIGAEKPFQDAWEAKTGGRMAIVDWWERSADLKFQHTEGRSCDLRDASLYVLQRHGTNVSDDSWCASSIRISERELRTTLGAAWFNR